jgi:hypothetical protein
MFEGQRDNLPFSVDMCASLCVSIVSSLPYRQTEIRRLGSSYKDKTACLQILKAYLLNPEDVQRNTSFTNMMRSCPSDENRLVSFHCLVLSLTRDIKDFIVDKNTLLLLPHEELESSLLIDSRIRDLEQFLSSFMSDMGGFFGCPLPMVITIARSASDGYTPQSVVNDIEKKTVRMLRSLVGNRELVIQDISEDPVAQSFSLFLPDAVKKYIEII